MAHFRIDNGKLPNEALSARLLFWLPPVTSYGNLQLKMLKIVWRIDQANRRIEESCRFWELAKCCAAEGTTKDVYSRHVFANEEAIYMMRRAADEIVSMIRCLSEREVSGCDPDKIDPDSIGRLLDALKKSRSFGPLAKHQKLLTVLNEISNAYKHSFIDSDVTHIGAEEPCIIASGLDHNRLSAGSKFHSLSLASLVRDYSCFYQDCTDWLRFHSERCRSKQTPA